MAPSQEKMRLFKRSLYQGKATLMFEYRGGDGIHTLVLEVNCLAYRVWEGNYPQYIVYQYDEFQVPEAPEGTTLIEQELHPLFNGKFEKTSQEVEVMMPYPVEGFIELSNGRFLSSDHSKYGSHLTYLSDQPEIVWGSESGITMNLGEGRFDVLIGNYFVSKKGTNCFSIQSDGKHMLLCAGWGGAFSRQRSSILRKVPEKDFLYWRISSSHGGGVGNDYAIIPLGWKFSIPEDEI